MNGVVARMLYMMVAAVPPFVYFTVKMNVNRRGRALFKPYAAAGQPKIGHFGLPAVYQLLAEYAELVAYAVAHSGVAAG